MLTVFGEELGFEGSCSHTVNLGLLFSISVSVVIYCNYFEVKFILSEGPGFVGQDILDFSEVFIDVARFEDNAFLTQSINHEHLQDPHNIHNHKQRNRHNIVIK